MRQSHECLLPTVPMPTILPAQKGMMVPKEGVYVKFVDWTYDPSTKYVAYSTHLEMASTRCGVTVLFAVFASSPFGWHPGVVDSIGGGTGMGYEDA